MLQRILINISLLLPLLFGAAISWACVDGERAATLEETAYLDKLKASLKAALPAAPPPLYLESEPVAYANIGCGKNAPVGRVKGSVTASYTAGLVYTDRVKLELRANYAYPDAQDVVIGVLPKKPAAYKVHNLVIKVDGYNPQYVAAIKHALDRARLQTIIGKPLPDTPPAAAWTVQSPAAKSSSTSSQASDRKSVDKPLLPDSTKSATDQAKDVVNSVRGLFGH
ncbi:MAG: hypothetical protein GC149_18430 [Gammaproteobacteria bacterium]|nr:hypothetical protein [Gammaproteobacteria bacterium]